MLCSSTFLLEIVGQKSVHFLCLLLFVYTLSLSENIYFMKIDSKNPKLHNVFFFSLPYIPYIECDAISFQNRI